MRSRLRALQRCVPVFACHKVRMEACPSRAGGEWGGERQVGGRRCCSLKRTFQTAFPVFVFELGSGRVLRLVYYNFVFAFLFGLKMRLVLSCSQFYYPVPPPPHYSFFKETIMRSSLSICWRSCHQDRWCWGEILVDTCSANDAQIFHHIRVYWRKTNRTI